MAHIEGFATYIQMLAFNNSFVGADCYMMDFDSEPFGSIRDNQRNCDRVGLTLKYGAQVKPSEFVTGSECVEWNIRSVFVQVGNEYDWARMYWDYFADNNSTSIGQYLNFESSVTNWSSRNRFLTIKSQMNSSQQAVFQQAAAGNIFDGAAH